MIAKYLCRRNINDFFKSHRPFVAACTLTLGALMPPIVALSMLLWRRKWMYITLFLGSIWMAATPSDLPEGYIKDIFIPQSISLRHGSFSTYYLYRGTCRGIPCTMTFRSKGKRPRGDGPIAFEGICTKRAPHVYTISSKKWEQSTLWKCSLIEWRVDAKGKIGAYLKRCYTDTLACGLLTALWTGDPPHPTLASGFARVGLSHLLAISGFHFALIALILAQILRPLCYFEEQSVILLIALGLYYLFIGPTPSIERAWIAVACYLISGFFGKKINPLNALGIATIFSFIRSPLCLYSLSFQLSYLATLGILFFYLPIKQSLIYYPNQKWLQFSLGDKHLYLLTTLMRTPLAITLSALALTLPLLLHTFHTFPLHALIFNIFAPLLLSLSLIFSLLGLLLPDICHPVAQAIASQLIQSTLYAPHTLLITYVPSAVTTYLLTLIPFTAGLLLYIYEKGKPPCRP